MNTATATKDPKKEQENPEEKAKKAVVEYLQAPRKKRKSYVVLAFGESFDSDTAAVITKYVRTQFPKLSVATPRNAEEFAKQFNRQIVLAIVDEHFVEREPTISLVRMLKEKKHDTATPILFLTNEPQVLIENYNRELSPWHEVDDYILLNQSSRPSIFQKIKTGIEAKNHRRSRRYKIDIPAKFSLLDQGDKKFEGHIMDLSLHGALLKTSDPHTFTQRDQIVVHLPYGNYIKTEDTDIVRFSARVRRVFINGDTAGISWEHLSESKLIVLTKIMGLVVDANMAKQASVVRAKNMKAPQEIVNPKLNTGKG